MRYNTPAGASLSSKDRFKSEVDRRPIHQHRIPQKAFDRKAMFGMCFDDVKDFDLISIPILDSIEELSQLKLHVKANPQT
jgi:hypothetical protein